MRLHVDFGSMPVAWVTEYDPYFHSKQHVFDVPDEMAQKWFKRQQEHKPLLREHFDELLNFSRAHKNIMGK